MVQLQSTKVKKKPLELWKNMDVELYSCNIVANYINN